MRSDRPSLPVMLGSALLGAGLVLLLLPSTRQILRRRARAWLRDLQEASEDFREGIEQEAGATEGGLAGIRGWGPGMAAQG